MVGKKLLLFYTFLLSGGQSEDEDNVPAKIYEQPELKQPDPSILVRIWCKTLLIDDFPQIGELNENKHLGNWI